MLVLIEDVLKLIIWWLLLLTNDVPEVERVFPEDKDEDDFEKKGDVGDQADEPAKFVLVATILFIFFWCAGLNQEQRDEVVDPWDGDHQNKSTEGLPRDSHWVIENVKCNGCNRQTQEAVALEHLEEDKDEEDPNDNLCNLKPGDGLDLVLLGELVDLVVEELLHLLLLREVRVVTLRLFILFMHVWLA